MNDTDRILLNQANIMRCLYCILSALAIDKGIGDTEAHKIVTKKLLDAAQESEDYATRLGSMQ